MKLIKYIANRVVKLIAWFLDSVTKYTGKYFTYFIWACKNDSEALMLQISITLAVLFYIPMVFAFMQFHDRPPLILAAAGSALASLCIFMGSMVAFGFLWMFGLGLKALFAKLMDLKNYIKEDYSKFEEKK